MTDDALYGSLLGVGLSAAAGLRLFVPLLVLSAASLANQVELSGGFDWIGTYPALVGFGVAAAVEIGAYLIPFLDNALDALAAPLAGVAGTVLTASSVVEMSPLLKWSLAVVAGGGIATTVHGLMGGVRLASTGTTLGLGNPAVGAAEAGGATALSLLALAVPLLAALVAVLLVVAALRLGLRLRSRRGRPLRARSGTRR